MYYTDMTHNIIYKSYTKSYSIVNLFCRIFKNKFMLFMNLRIIKNLIIILSLFHFVWFLGLSVKICFSLMFNLNSNQYLVDMKIN